MRCWALRFPSGYFYPRPPCGGRHDGGTADRLGRLISIHALLAEGDQIIIEDGRVRGQISIHALLAEGDHGCAKECPANAEISIHALLAEGDLPWIFKPDTGC